MTSPDLRLQLAERIGEFCYSPLDYARFAFPWESEQLPETGPRTWQADTFQQIGDHLQSPLTRHQPLRIATASGHGIGKSAGISMVTKWALDTCVDTRIVITANTESQLRTKTSPEIAKWAKLAITRDWFKPSTTSLASTMPGRSQSWRADLVTWSEHNTEAFAGLHIRDMTAEELLDAGMVLFAQHREELTTDKALMVLNPCREIYLHIDSHGGMISLGAFTDDGALIGYSANTIGPNLHYADLLMYANDVLFVMPEHRGTSAGIRLIRETEARAKARGCQLMLWHAKPGTALDCLLPRMGCRVQDIIHSKVLD